MRKRVREALISIVSCVLMTFLLGGCTGYGEQVTEGPWSAYLGKNDAFIYEYRWDGTEEGLRIEPGMLKGLPVTRYGGYMGRGVPMQFSIQIPGAGLCRQKVVPQEEIIGTIEFTLVIGSQISDVIISNSGLGGYYLLDEREDGKLTLETNFNTDGTIFDIYQYEYDDRNRLIEKTNKSEDGYVYRNWKYQYNDAGELVHLTDTFYEHRIEYSYDEKERPILEEGYYNEQPSYVKRQIFGPFGIVD